MIHVLTETIPYWYIITLLVYTSFIGITLIVAAVLDAHNIDGKWVEYVSKPSTWLFDSRKRLAWLIVAVALAGVIAIITNL